MSDELPGSGRGHYTNARGGKQLWGFLELQVARKGGEILVHETFVEWDPAKSDYGEEKVYGSVWTPI